MRNTTHQLRGIYFAKFASVTEPIFFKAPVWPVKQVKEFHVVDLNYSLSCSTLFNVTPHIIYNDIYEPSCNKTDALNTSAVDSLTSCNFLGFFTERTLRGEINLHCLIGAYNINLLHH